MQANNMVAMHEALEKLRAEIVRFYANEWIPYDAWQGCDEIISNALAAPPKNCDVGTAEEQARRFGAICIKYYNDEDKCDEKCPLAAMTFIKGFPRCQAYWSQMPYEEKDGGAS